MFASTMHDLELGDGGGRGQNRLANVAAGRDVYVARCDTGCRVWSHLVSVTFRSAGTWRTGEDLRGVGLKLSL